jgi:hypothetical protein
MALALRKLKALAMRRREREGKANRLKKMYAEFAPEGPGDADQLVTRFGLLPVRGPESFNKKS